MLYDCKFEVSADGKYLNVYLHNYFIGSIKLDEVYHG